jgi:flagellar basal body rod protein FlgG
MYANGGKGPLIGTLGCGTILKNQFTVFRKGAITVTNNPLDVAIRTEQGLFAVQTPSGIRYTRNGAFQLDTTGRLVTHSKEPVLDTNLREIVIPPMEGKIAIGEDGTIKAGGVQIAKIGVFSGNFKKVGKNLYRCDNAQLMENINLQAGAIERSAVDPIESMVKMIDIHRHFELSQANIQRYDESIQRVIQALTG